MNQTEIDELRRLHEAATPGPWRWRINRSSKTAEIETPKEGGWTIMGFERWGMDGACPSFRMEQNGHSLLTRADQMAVDIPGREHHSEWFQGIDNDDANLMTAARNALPRLLAALEEAQAKLAKVQDAMETWFVDGDDTKLVTGLDMALAARAS